MELMKTYFGGGTNWRRSLWAMALSGTLILSSGCLNLEPRVDPTRFYILEADGGAAAEEARPAEQVKGFLEVRLIHFPEYAQRTGLAVREGPHEIRYLPWHRWGEPPETSFAAAAVQALAGELPQWTIRSRSSDGAAILEVEILRWDAFARGEAVLEARWRYRDGGGPKADSPETAPWHRGMWTTDWDPGQPARLVAAHSENIRQWAAVVAEELRNR